MNINNRRFLFPVLIFLVLQLGVAQEDKIYLVTDFDGNGILPDAWDAYGDLATYGVRPNNASSDGKFYELVWNGSTSEGYLTSQSGITFRLIPKKRLKDKSIDHVFLKMDVNCAGAPGSKINIVLVDGPNDCCTNDVNWQYTFTKSNEGWETIEVNVAEFGYGYDPSNHSKYIDINKIGRVKVGLDVFSGAARQVVQFDNVALVVKENIETSRYDKGAIIPEDVVLKTAAKDFMVGVAVNPKRIKDKAYDEVYKKEFNSITAENAMKMKSILKGMDENGNPVFDWTQSDAIVEYAMVNNMNLHGHTLVWYNSIPEFLMDFKGSDQEFDSFIEKYITEVVTRYKGKVASWDVVNEAIDEGTSEFRKSIFYDRMGSDYVKKCFQYARNADMEVKLFYNDYGLVYDKKKQEGTFDMVDDLMADGLIDGVGIQMHIDFNFPSKKDIQDATDRIVQRKLLVHFSELDVKTNPKGEQQEFTKDRIEQQAQKIFVVVQVYNSIPKAYKYALTVWGLKDDDSWITPTYGFPDWPLLFDSNFDKKRAYSGFLQALEEPNIE